MFPKSQAEIVETLKMSRGPGHVQQKVAALVAANPDDAWTTTKLCELIYGGQPEKKHRVAVIRALLTMELPDLWWVQPLECQGSEYCLYNAGSTRSTQVWSVYSRGRNPTDPAEFKEWGMGAEDAAEKVREAVDWHKATPVQRLDVQIKAALMYGDRDHAAELRRERDKLLASEK